METIYRSVLFAAESEPYLGPSSGLDPDEKKPVSRAFVNEDAGSGDPIKGFGLPARDDPSFDAVAAEVLLEAARNGETSSAEQATGYYWGEPRLKEHVRRILERAQKAGDDRLEQLARRFLR